MKRFSMLFTALFLLLILTVMPGQAANYPADGYVTTTYEVGPGYVAYKIFFDGMTADSLDDFYSHAIEVGFQDRTQNIIVAARTTNRTGTEDVDLNILWCNEPQPNIADAVADTEFDINQLTASTIQTDTLNTAAAVKGAQYVIFKADGQTANSSDELTIWIVVPVANGVKIDKPKIVTVTAS